VSGHHEHASLMKPLESERGDARSVVRGAREAEPGSVGDGWLIYDGPSPGFIFLLKILLSSSGRGTDSFRRTRPSFGSGFHTVQPCEQLCHCPVEFWRNMLVHVHLHQQGDQLWRFMDINVVCPRLADDGFSYQPAALGDYSRGGLPFSISQRHGSTLWLSPVLHGRSLPCPAI